MDELFCLSKGTPPVNKEAIPFKPLLQSADPDYPGATWQNSPNYWAGRDGEDVISICNHIMQATMESANSWFKNNASQVSAHFGVARDGRVYQWVKVANTAWANGIMNKPDTSVAWINQCYTKGINPNFRTISIEHEGLSGQAFTNAQFQATLALHKFLIKTFNIPIERIHLIGHYMIDSVNRPNCPGAGFPWGRLISELKGGSTSNLFDPNPKKFSVGPGMLAKLTELKLTAETNEMYFNPGPNQLGLGKMSQLWTSLPGLKLEAYEQLDANNQPTGYWDVQAYKQL